MPGPAEGTAEGFVGTEFQFYKTKSSGGGEWWRLHIAVSELRTYCNRTVHLVIIKMVTFGPGMMVCACNPSNSGGKGRKNEVPGWPQAKKKKSEILSETLPEQNRLGVGPSSMHP